MPEIEPHDPAEVEVDRVDPTSDVAVESLTAYFDELERRFATGFERGDTVTADAPAFTPPSGAFLVGLVRGRPVSCGGVQRHDRETGEIKRMWVDPAWRGVGLGGRMLRALESTARDLGYTRIVLDTNERLGAAIGMYRRAGYLAIDRYNDNPYAHHWFAKSLTT